MKKVLLSALVVSLLAACASTPAPEAPKAPVENKTQPQVEAPKADTAPAPTDGLSTSNLPPHQDPNNKLSERSIYFDYDKYVVRDDHKALVEAHSKYLTEKRDLKVKIEGNADERGSREYNLALGQKRAEAVKKMMSTLGVSDSQIETISYGEEKPKATGHDEEAYAINRRADIVYADDK
ncbi:peptidoglycan-associated lipoprotein [Chitinivorax tropicus]|uniref:Peptidoglycan-associated lipoprotein n=1 Tax=Chitinivorax tropicus TaxID=714531 RepID=A0A840MKD5_9PROT|nr:peptidoglycan-associated lipoprotein Pal [Chitinivorax tropicus]MBB5017307.1 peptidoglycan-associated lipoprotein [Chitinivorax tropicus]